MTLHFENCPLLTYLESKTTDYETLAPVREMLNASQSGNTDMIYGYGLFLFEAAHNETIYPQFKDIPHTVKKAMDERAFEAFAYASGMGHGDAALMASFSLLNGQGIQQDSTSAALFYAQAQKSVHEADPRMKSLKSAFEAMNIDIPPLPAQKNVTSDIDAAQEHAPLAPQSITTVTKTDIAAIIAPLTAPTQTPNNMYLVSALSELSDWINDGFKNEENKGTLYFCLIRAIDDISKAISKSPNSQPEFDIDTTILGMFKTSFCQINEAALQTGGVAKELRNVWLPHYGYGHAPAAQKSIGNKLRAVAQNCETFFAKNDIATPDTKATDKYSTPTTKNKTSTSGHTPYAPKNRLN